MTTKPRRDAYGREIAVQGAPASLRYYLYFITLPWLEGNTSLATALYAPVLGQDRSKKTQCAACTGPIKRKGIATHAGEAVIKNTALNLTVAQKAYPQYVPLAGRNKLG